MEPSSSTPKNLLPPPKPTELTELSRIRELLASLVAQVSEQEATQRQLAASLTNIERLLEGFTSGGSSFQAYQVSPLTLVYASILGPILGDRIDGTTPKGDGYLDEMTKGAAVMARRLLRTLDSYQGDRGIIDYLEANCGDIKPPDEPVTGA